MHALDSQKILSRLLKHDMSFVENLVSAVALIVILVILCFPNFLNEATAAGEYLKAEEKKMQNFMWAKLQFMKLKVDQIETKIQQTVSEEAEVPPIHKFLFF